MISNSVLINSISLHVHAPRSTETIAVVAPAVFGLGIRLDSELSACHPSPAGVSKRRTWTDLKYDLKYVFRC
jgi:hypothetical protein